jgi:hypothetical protein
MEELIEKLKKACDEMELITELTLKYKDIKVVGEKLLQKQIEDGYLANLCNANIHQLNMLKKHNYFRYYDKELTDKIIDSAILKLIRKEKLNKINNG